MADTADVAAPKTTTKAPTKAIATTAASAEGASKRAAVALTLTKAEARGLLLAAQSLFDPPPRNPDAADVQGMVERLGVVQIDTINVARRSQYLVLWSRLGAYDEADFDALLYPRRAVFEYWAHAASILPTHDLPYYLAMMAETEQRYFQDERRWAESNPEVVMRTVEAIRGRGPLASADFERPNDGRRAEAWDWHGLKEERHALAVLWTLGDVMVHSRRGGQKVYDLRENVLAEVFAEGLPDLPTTEERLQFLTRRTLEALGVVVPSWLFNYYSLAWPETTATSGNRRVRSRTVLDALVESGGALPATIEGLNEPAYVDPARLLDLDRLRAGETSARTTLLSPFDSLIWDRARTRALFDYEVVFEAYVVPEKRRYGYYCLAILHQGRLVGRLDPKMDRDDGVLHARAVYLEPGVKADAALLDGLADALRDLARFLGAHAVVIDRSEPEKLAERLQKRVAGTIRPRARK